MAAPLKDFFDRALVQRIGGMFAAVHPDFPRDRFEAEAADGLEAHELMGRGAHIAAALARALPDDRVRALAIVVASAGPPLGEPGSFGMAPFLYLPHTMFVAEHGLAHPEAAFDALAVLTTRFTAEFAIRPFLVAHDTLTRARLSVWAGDSDPHLRRLVSEGTRPRLPWATRVPALIADPSPNLPLLSRLRDDPSEYVRRSVANHLNDIGKDHPELLLRVATDWWADAPPERQALLRHALRDRVKKGDRAVISLLGAGGGTFAVQGELPTSARLGGALPVVVHVQNTGAEAARAVVDLLVEFPGRSAAGRRKVFKLKTVALAPGESVTLRKSISLADHTTREALPGPHRLSVQVDGERREIGAVAVA
jgi:3-methyladenine DNA glycosylase AlkC